MTRLEGRHAVVTGGGSGIGAEIARTLAAEGARVTLVGRRREPLEAIGAELGALVAPADVTDRAQVENSFGVAREANGAIDILVNNAGASESAPFRAVTPESWRRAMAVNLDAVLHCCQAALADLLASQNGRIVTVASTAGLKGYAFVAPYVAAKHAAVGLTRALAAELARTSVTVNAVCPGFTDTPMTEQSAERIAAATKRSPQEAKAALERFNPQGRLITPQEVASAVLWLCLPESASVTGQAIAIDGGETA